MPRCARSLPGPTLRSLTDGNLGGVRARSSRVPPQLVGSLVLLLFFISTAAFAAEPASAPASKPTKIVLEHTPPGVGIEITTKIGKALALAPGLYRVYTIEEWKELVVVDARVTALEKGEELLEDEVGRLEEMVELADVRASSFETDLKEERAISNRLTKKWEKCDLDLEKAKAGSFWPWIAVGVGGALAVAGGVALAVALTKK